MTDLSTANVTDTKSGTGWTIDVTACNLLSDLSIKDFIVLIAGTLEPNSNITKTSQTVLTYNGTSIASSTVEVRRVTPQDRFQEIAFSSKFSSTVYNEEVDRIIRRSYEYTLNGIGPGSTATIQTPLDDVYSATWNGDTIRPATRNALYDKIELLGDLADNEAITGNWTAPTQADANNTTRLATTAYTDTRVTNALASSPTLGGNPTTTTQAVGNDSTRLATTAFVQANSGRGVEVCILEDQRTSGTAGGTTTAATWHKRVINTVVLDEIGVTIGSNEFTLPGGTKDGVYVIEWSAPCHMGNIHRTRLINSSGPTTVARGESCYASSTDEVNTHSRGSTAVDISANTTYYIEHYAQTAKVGDGLGVASSVDVETYARVTIMYRKGT